jgi:hypothetical protein
MSVRELYEEAFHIYDKGRWTHLILQDLTRLREKVANEPNLSDEERIWLEKQISGFVQEVL